MSSPQRLILDLQKEMRHSSELQEQVDFLQGLLDNVKEAIDYWPSEPGRRGETGQWKSGARHVTKLVSRALDGEQFSKPTK